MADIFEADEALASGRIEIVEPILDEMLAEGDFSLQKDQGSPQPWPLGYSMFREEPLQGRTGRGNDA
ncbi:MAG: hypothetical protein GY725_14780 [bacterium]|nr:hypothetical protein [bacterium]